VLVEARPEGLLDLQVLEHGLDDKVGRADESEVV
jgi:hypothetical protein